MDKINRFLINNFFKVFIPLFFTLFSIASILFFIMISRFTSYLTLTFLELGEIFIYLLPRIIIFTLPVSFFVSLAISAFNMSKESENIVLFSLGYPPKKIASLYFVLSLLTSVFLLVNVLFILPTAKQLYKNFIEIKKVEAKINIKPTEFGQRFSDWMVFINKTDNNGYKDIILYNQKKKKETFILANHAKINHEKGLLNLSLDNGKTFYITDKEIKQIDYAKMNINNFLRGEELHNDTMAEYWKKALTDQKRAKDLSFLTLTALFPLVSFLFALAIATLNIRHDRVHLYPFLFAMVISYYIVSIVFAKTFPFVGIVAVSLLYYIFSKIFFVKKVVKRF